MLPEAIARASASSSRVAPVGRSPSRGAPAVPAPRRSAPVGSPPPPGRAVGLAPPRPVPPRPAPPRPAPPRPRSQGFPPSPSAQVAARKLLQRLGSAAHLPLLLGPHLARLAASWDCSRPRRHSPALPSLPAQQDGRDRAHRVLGAGDAAQLGLPGTGAASAAAAGRHLSPGPLLLPETSTGTQVGA